MVDVLVAWLVWLMCVGITTFLIRMFPSIFFTSDFDITNNKMCLHFLCSNPSRKPARNFSFVQLYWRTDVNDRHYLYELVDMYTDNFIDDIIPLWETLSEKEKQQFSEKIQVIMI